MEEIRPLTRRSLIGKGGAVLTAGLVLPFPLWGEEKQEKTFRLVRDHKKTEVEVSPTEDLMMEHGALTRLLLIYEEIRSRLKEDKAFPPQVLVDSAGLIRRFIEEYHEKLEEEHIFPRFEKAGKLTELVRILRKQHRAGRNLTDKIRNQIQGAVLNPGEREKLMHNLSSYAGMNRPHKAREDTKL
jgi:hemerythrin-like domain-containing protein